MASSVLPSGLAEAFGLSPVEIRMRSGRMMSVHYDVVDATGQEWFLKCSPTDHRIEHLDLLRAVHGRLNACRISVPIMRPTCDGRSGWVEGGRLYACYSLMPSERDALPREDGEAAGALLGRIHRALHGAAFTGAVWARSLHDVRKIQEAIIPWLGFMSSAPSDPMDRMVQPYLMHIARSLSELPELSRSLAPRQLLHGDFNPQNLVISGGRVAGCIDFGDATIGHPAEDVAEALLYFGGVEEGGRWEADRSLARQFLRGYLSEAPLGPEWVERLPLVLAAQSLRQLSKFTVRWNLYKRVPGVRRYISQLLCTMATPDRAAHAWHGLAAELHI